MATLSPAEIDVIESRLTAADRCDSCGAQAYIAAEVNGSELLFCAHHGELRMRSARSLTRSWWPIPLHSPSS